jgi:chitinase
VLILVARGIAQQKEHKQMKQRTFLLPGICAVMLMIVTVSLVLWQSKDAHAQGIPARYTAPYADVTLSPPIAEAIQNGGSRFYTLAFVIDGGNCKASWAGLPLTYEPVQSIVSTVRNAGGDVIASFGGASGVELALVCPSVSALQAQYQAVIDQYHFTHLDFDIEGGALGYADKNDLRNKAIAALQRANPGLKISFTLPVMPSGLTQYGLDMLKNAVQNGVDINIVNVMAMDYYNGTTDMGQAAIDAANSTYSQLQSIIPGMSWAKIGVTPMIGVNDDRSEIFTTQDAQELVSFAQQKQLGMLSFWSIARDRACSSTGQLSPTCSGVQQSPFAFSQIFGSYGGGGGTPTTPTPTKTTTPTPTQTVTPTSTPQTTWQAGTAYKVGDRVLYNGVTYICLQAHTALPGWEPPNVPALWKPA